VRAFYGNFGVLVRALAYILVHGGPGLRNATVDAVLNAVYIRKQLEPYFDLPYPAPNMHEVVSATSAKPSSASAQATWPSA